VLVHHGLIWKSDWPLRVVGSMRRRLGALVENGISLVGYHLPLDAHPEVGNNAVAAARLGLREVAPFGEYNGRTIGCQGRLPEPLAADELALALREVYGSEPLCLAGTREPIERIGMISGGAASEYGQAVSAGLDAYVTGEPAEWAMHRAREEGPHFFACGHHATERLGVQALGQRLVEVFGIECEFVDLPNPV
jgi:dinuclear metal center YbgI/SA1388 family protein